MPLLAVVVLLPITDANAEVDWGDETQFHLSGGVGKSFVSPKGYSNGWHTVGDSSDGYKLRLGYQFSPRWFAEVSYVDAGEADIGNRNPGITDVAAIAYQVPALFAGFNLRKSDDPWNVHVKLGVAKIRNESDDDRVTFDQQSSAQVAVGIASEWNVTRRWFYSFEYEYYARDASFASFNIGWRFHAAF